jgi:2-isopropylmalate synthase
VGANAFAHESGIHQDGMLKHGATYEIMRPESVGLASSRLVLGKHSGRHALAARLSELGYTLEGGALDTVFSRFKALADRKKQVADADLIALVTSQQKEVEASFTLEGLQIACGTIGAPTATVRIADASGRVDVQAAMGTGPVDACFKAIDAVIGQTPCLLEYSVHAVTEGIDALGEVSVRIRGSAAGLNPQHGETRDRVYHGHGADTDILVASAKAYLCAINRMLAAEPRLTARAS